MSSPIDRALERLENITDCYYAKQIEDILTDLVAEIRAEYLDKLDQAQHFNLDLERENADLKARLAAVVEWLQTSLDCAIATGYGMEKEEIVDLLALARGEGGEQDPTGTGAPDSGTTGKPAAPDANDHSYPAEQLRHAIWEKGQREHDAPDAGTKPQQSPASDGGLDDRAKLAEVRAWLARWDAWGEHAPQLRELRAIVDGRVEDHR